MIKDDVANFSGKHHILRFGIREDPNKKFVDTYFGSGSVYEEEEFCKPGHKLCVFQNKGVDSCKENSL